MSDPAQFLHLKINLALVVNFPRLLGNVLNKTISGPMKKFGLGVDKVNAYPVIFMFYIL
jgi:hypothetical protein